MTAMPVRTAMMLYRRLLFAAIRLPLGPLRRTGANGSPPSAPVIDPDFHGNRLKEALFRHYVHQFTPAACSAATVATVVNAVAAVQGRRRPPVTQAQLLDAVPTGHWKARMHPGGYRGRRGLPLPWLCRVVEDSLKAYGLRYRRVTSVRAAKPETAPARKIAADLRARLHRFETRGDVLIIAHFDQGETLATLHIPHISPVGGYDGPTEAVTILDVDADQAPYTVSFDTFYRAISSDYHHLFRPFGYGRGGCVIVELP
jgi:hypothetical protein